MRFRTIDGLRGIAALAVVLYHLAGAVTDAGAQAWLPASAHWVIARGFLGVDVFFVLSGFVIAYSTRNATDRFSYLGRFALRRSIRLDPPYWLTILLELAVVTLTVRFFPGFDPAWPSGAQLGAHLLYAQNVLGYGDILPIFWTLCYEIQFYVGFVLLLILWKRFGGRQVTGAAAGLGVLFALSLFIRYADLTLVIPGLALERWFQFFLGVLAWWVVDGKIRLPLLIAAALLTAIAALGTDHGIEQLTAPVTACFIAVTGLLNGLGSVLANRPLQFLGKISYSLYLTHLIAGSRFVALGGAMLPLMTRPLAWVLYLAGIGVSIVAAAMLWYVVERPTMQFSKRIQLVPAPSPSVTPALAPAGD